MITMVLQVWNIQLEFRKVMDRASKNRQPAERKSRPGVVRFDDIHGDNHMEQ